MKDVAFHASYELLIIYSGIQTHWKAFAKAPEGWGIRGWWPSWCTYKPNQINLAKDQRTNRSDLLTTRLTMISCFLCGF